MPHPTRPLKIGSRCIVLGHRHWQGGQFEGYEGTIEPNFCSDAARGLINRNCVSFPWLKREVYLPDCCVCPVYNDCEDCGYAAWSAIEGEDGWHHYCAWCVKSHAC